MAGKSSSQLEPVAWGIWGKTLSKEPVETKGAVVEITTATHQFRRELKANGTQLFRFGRLGETPAEYTTTTKATAAVEAEFGSFEMWRRTNVFTSLDAAVFSAATDSQRKQFLELLLGIDGRFNEPLKQLKTEVKERALAGQSLAQRLKAIEASQAELQDILAKSALQQQEGTYDPAQARADEARYHELDTAIRQTSAKVGAAQQAVTQAHRSRLQLSDGKCVACGSVIPADTITAQEEGVARARREAERVQAECKDELAQLTETLSTVRRQLEGHRQRQMESRVAAQVRAQAASTEGRLAALDAELFDTSLDLTQLEEEYAFLKDVERALGSEGVRAMMFGRALTSLEKLTNAYISWLHPDVRVKLSPTKEKKDGETVDAITLTIENTGNGSYRACSQGAKRRIDLALLLALSRLSPNKGGTLYLDEAFDGLDEQGVQGACELLAHLGKQTHVILITHNKQLASTVDAVQHIEF